MLHLFVPFFLLTSPPSVAPPRRPFISNRAILSHRRLSRSTQVRFYLRHRNSSFLHIYYLTPAWSRILYVLCGRPRTLYPSRRDIFLLKEKERLRRRSRLAREILYTRDCSVFFSLIFLCRYNFLFLYANTGVTYLYSFNEERCSNGKMWRRNF